MNNATAETETEKRNKAAVQAAFDAWRAGTGGPFTLLAPDATWTITGNSLAAKTYNSRDEFIGHGDQAFNARLTKPLVPTMRSLHSDGDTVIALFDGEALALDGKPYRNREGNFFMADRDVNWRAQKRRLLGLIALLAREFAPIDCLPPRHRAL